MIASRRSDESERYFSEEYDDLSPDACLDAMWERCIGMDDAADVQVSAWHDMWWGVKVTCPHGAVRGFSRGTLDVSNGFRHALDLFMDLHKGDREETP